MNKLVVGVDLGGTNIKTGVVNSEGKVLVRCRMTTQADRGPEGVADRINETIEQCREKLSEQSSDIVGAGIGSPGPLDLKRGIVIFAPNLEGWDNVPLQQMIEDRSGLPCFLENDANAAALGEQWVGAGKNASSLVQFTLGTGIGGGIVLNGKVWHGFRDCAGEIGHMTLEPEGPICGCGNRGCVEALASATNMVRRMQETIDDGGETILREKRDELTARDIYEAAVEGDEPALENMETTGYYLGTAVANILHILNPEVIVFSGGVTAAGNMLMQPIRQTAKKRTMEACWRGTKIRFAELGDDAGIIGAARSYMVERMNQ
ncbi:MAG: ROK family protein [Candidatus Brocadiia bacterium]